MTANPAPTLVEERARVVALGPGLAWVETERRSACGSCPSSIGCATPVLGRLAGSGTHFLPFNRGWDGGAGNPPDKAGRNYKTAYLWEEVLSRDSLLDLLARFLHLDIDEKVTDDGKKVRKETMIFPRYHQLQAVRQMIADAKQHGAGQNYLI